MTNKKTRRIAAIDIGSNSVRLLVADISGDFILPLHKNRSVTRLLQGIQGNELGPDAISRTCAAIADFAAEARSAGAEEIAGFGTSAMRDGANSNELIDFAASAGVRLQILSGDEEAQLAYVGAAPRGRSGVLDIGGGSTEWLVGEDGRISCAVSAQIGAVRMMQAMAGASPRQMIGRAKEIMRFAAEETRIHPVEQWIGVGGSITTLAAMLLQLEVYDDAAVDGFVIRRDQAKSWLDMLWAMPIALRGQLKGMDSARADIIPCGIAILMAFFELSSADKIAVSGKSNLEGFMRAYMMREPEDRT